MNSFSSMKTIIDHTLKDPEELLQTPEKMPALQESMSTSIEKPKQPETRPRGSTIRRKEAKKQVKLFVDKGSNTNLANNKNDYAQTEIDKEKIIVFSTKNLCEKECQTDLEPEDKLIKGIFLV